MPSTSSRIGCGKWWMLSGWNASAGSPWRVCSSCPPGASRYKVNLFEASVNTGPVHYENLSSPLGHFVLPREQKSPQSLLPNLHVASIGT